MTIKAPMMLVPSAVPTGYAGEGRPYAFNPEYFLTKAVYGPPSIMFASTIAKRTTQAGYWPHVDHQAYNQFLHPVTSAEAPPIRMRGATKAKPGTRVAFKGPQYMVTVKAPSIDEVKSFMAARGPQG